MKQVGIWMMVVFEVRWHPEASTVTNGSGNMQVNLSERLHSIISGSGSVYYKGDPVVSSKISGSGRVVRL